VGPSLGVLFLSFSGTASDLFFSSTWDLGFRGHLKKRSERLDWHETSKTVRSVDGNDDDSHGQ
jgi:hypothetical protein